MKKLLNTLLFALCCALRAQGQVLVLDVSATPANTAPHITLKWTQEPAATLGTVAFHRVSRRPLGGTDWTLLTSTLPFNATSYADGTAGFGTAYEYEVQRDYISSTLAGYLAAGVDAPMTDDRGKLILIVDATMATPLAAELAQLQQDLAGDGWRVIRHDVPRMAVDPFSKDPALYAARAAELAYVKSLIVADYNADPANVRAVYLLGRVPVPYSGQTAADGHMDHAGAWPADGFYGDMDGVWTDNAANLATASQTRHHNIPGDGKFDQNQFPGNRLELAVGRVDLSNMTKFPNAGTTETQLLAQYLRRAHTYRHGQIWGNGRTVQRRTGVVDNMGWWGYSSVGTAIGYSCVGKASTANVGAWFSDTLANAMSKSDYLIGAAVGGGGPESMMNVGTSADFGTKGSKAVFNGLYGSYFGDWDYANCFLRAPLAATPDSLGLASFWMCSPSWYLHHMGLGETIGFAARYTLNIEQDDSGTHHAAMALMGDPSLRLHVVLPPANVQAQEAGGSVSVAWEASPDGNVLGYHVYRGPGELGPFIRLNGGMVRALSFTDTGAPAGQTYMVRAVKRESSPGGSYLNLSQGAFTRTAPSSVAVTYDANGADSGTAPTAQTKTQGETLTLATNNGNLALTGKVFAGWNTKAGGDGTDFAAGGSYSADTALTLYATWTTSATYAVTYNKNSATGGTAPPPQTKINGVTLTLAANSGGLFRDGYLFAGWNTAADGNGTDYAAGALYTANQARTLYAKWTALTYLVTYDGNGATSGTVPPVQSKTHGVALTLSTNHGDLRKAGYVLAGWNTQADGGGTDYATGASYTANAAIALYAKWTVSTSTQTVTATAGPNGAIAPSGAVILNTGESQSFTITPAFGYRVADVLVDGVSVGAVTSYTFPSVTNSRTIAASFEIGPPVALAWGDNGNGELGDGSRETRSSPVYVLQDGQPMQGIVAFSAYEHTMALRGDGRVFTWGRNNYGQLGDGTTTPRIAPALVAGLTDVTAVAAENHSVALKADGTVWAWGRGDYGQLGNGGKTNAPTPVQANITGVTAIAAGWWATVALKADGTVWEWGYHSLSRTATVLPVQLPTLSGIVAIAAKSFGRMALKNDGTVWVWGYASGTPPHYAPCQADGLSEVTAIAVGDFHMLALRSDGAVWSWGYSNRSGQLGDGTTTSTDNASSFILRPALIADVVAIAAGSEHSLAIKADGSAWAWGSDSSGQLGVGGDLAFPVNQPTPVQVPGSQPYVALFGGEEQSFALAQPRTVVSYAVAYFANNATAGTAPVAQTKIHDVELILADSGSLAKTGYTFAGWNTRADGSGISYAAGAIHAANAPLALYAQWTLNTYSVTYAANDATAGAAPGAQAKTHGVALTLAGNPGNLARDGFNFAGWNTAADGGGTSYAEGSPYAADAGLTLFARWTTQPTYAVSYDANEADGGSAPVSQTKIVDAPLILAGPGSLVKTGHTFAGWNTAAGGGGTSYVAGAPYDGNAALALYAQWTLNTYAVTYDANGAAAGSAPDPQTKDYGVALTLAGNTGSLTKTGLIFAGWNTAADGGGTDYAAGVSYTGNAALALYAKWTGTITEIDFEANGRHYRLVRGPATWENARTRAANATHPGMQGYLAVIECQAEQDALFARLDPLTNPDVQELLKGIEPHPGSIARAVWLGGSDSPASIPGASEGRFFWIPKVNSGSKQFWQGDQQGSPVAGAFVAWGWPYKESGVWSKEPNNGDYRNEHHVGMQLEPWYGWEGDDPQNQAAAGLWNDLDGTVPQPYLIEFEALDGFPDANGNGVDDRWEQEHWPGGTPPATVTKRGREMPLREVFVADLDPFDPDSVLEITRFGLLWKDGARHTELDFGYASTNRLYDLEAAPHVTGVWQRVRGDIVPDAASFRIETPVGEAPQGFYRIQVRLPPGEDAP